MRPPPGPDFVKICLYLRTLPGSTLITREQFVDDGKQRLWQWAARQGVPSSVKPRARRTSPWHVLVAGQTAATVLQALPPWAELLDAPALSAAEVLAELEKPTLREAATMWRRLYAGLLDRLGNGGATRGPLVVASVRLPTLAQFEALTERIRAPVRP